MRSGLREELDKDKGVVETVELKERSGESTPSGKDGTQSTKSAELSTSAVPQQAAKPKSMPMKVIRFLQDQWFLITMVILMAIASQHQVPKEHQKTKTTVVTYLCVSIIFFVTGNRPHIRIHKQDLIT